MSMTETWPVLGFIVAISSVVAWIRHPQHILTWSQIPFFLVHEMIAHKECRFFFPIASAAPILLTLSLYSSKTHTLGSLKRNWNTLWQWSWQFIALNNGIALLVLMFTPFARVVQFYEGVYDHIPPQQQKFELYFSGRDPYRILGTPIYFYRPEQLVLKEFHEYSELNSILEQRQKLKDLKGLQEPLWLFDPNFHLPSSANELLTHCSVVFRTLPPTVENWNWGNWLERTLTWTLYRCVR
jgi:phosphatidylinositol glycan class B